MLEDVVATHLAARDRGVVEVSGGPLMGKTTAIEYLDQVFAAERNLTLVDASAHLQHCFAPIGRVTVSTAPSVYGTASLGKYQLAPWGQDEWIEYLLAAHKSRCGSVMNRLRATREFSFLGGNPGLWRLVLEELALNDSISSASEALRWAVTHLFSTSPAYHSLQKFSLVAAAPLPDELDRETRSLAKLTIERELLRLLALDAIRNILAGEALTLNLQDDNVSHLRRILPIALIHEIAWSIKANHSLQGKLLGVLAGTDAMLHAMAASLLHAAEIGWQPVRPSAAKNAPACKDLPKLPDLSNAYLVGAHWPGIDLRDARLTAARLSGANLENADLDGANLVSADLSGAKLHGASLANLNAAFADLARADLSFARAPEAKLEADLSNANLEGALLTDVSLEGANLTGARFVRANLTRAQLTQANILNADFTQANLQRCCLSGLDLRIACFDFAIFTRAKLHKCNLEGMKLSGADFEGADLQTALLTSSTMFQANLRGADLRGAGLADVEWEGVDLRGADLRKASFHLGSTRCGLVDSPYPSHGTRTGFYTDDYNEQDFKSPEEIRKANLCGADLRGANIEGVDFYLVDVRDAQYDYDQMVHLRQCGAILKARAV